MEILSQDEWSCTLFRLPQALDSRCNGITFTTKYNTLSTDYDKGEFIPDCCIASREAPPAYHTYALVIVIESVGLQWRPSLLGRADSERYCAVVISLHQVNLVYMQRAETCRGTDKRS